jgi:hypothetical protein
MLLLIFVIIIIGLCAIHFRPSESVLIIRLPRILGVGYARFSDFEAFHPLHCRLRGEGFLKAKTGTHSPRNYN